MKKIFVLFTLLIFIMFSACDGIIRPGVRHENKVLITATVSISPLSHEEGTSFIYELKKITFRASKGYGEIVTGVVYIDLPSNINNACSLIYDETGQIWENAFILVAADGDATYSYYGPHASGKNSIRMSLCQKKIMLKDLPSDGEIKTIKLYNNGFTVSLDISKHF